MELKPCLCGSKVKVWYDGGWYVECLSSSCRARTRHFIDLDNAIEAWNTRAERTCEYEFVPNIGGGHLNACGLRCTSCGREQMSLEAPKFCPDCGAKVVSE